MRWSGLAVKSGGVDNPMVASRSTPAFGPAARGCGKFTGGSSVARRIKQFQGAKQQCRRIHF
jgi:hypothetical protein